MDKSKLKNKKQRPVKKVKRVVKSPKNDLLYNELKAENMLLKELIDSYLGENVNLDDTVKTLNSIISNLQDKVICLQDEMNNNDNIKDLEFEIDLNDIIDKRMEIYDDKLPTITRTYSSSSLASNKISRIPPRRIMSSTECTTSRPKPIVEPLKLRRRKTPQSLYKKEQAPLVKRKVQPLKRKSKPCPIMNNIK